MKTWLAALTIIQWLILSLLLSDTRPARAADAIPGEQWCDRIVDEIQFQGNEVTRSQVIVRELVQLEGRACVLDDIIAGIQRILDLGLFKAARAELAITHDRLILSYILEEKIFFLPIPRLSRTSDGELRYGAQLRWDNFQGRLHQMKLTGEKRQENDGRGRSGYIYQLDYTVPRFFGSRLGMVVSVAAKRRDTALERNGIRFGEALQKSHQLEWRLSRWAGSSQGIQGLSYFAGAGFEEREYVLREGRFGPFEGGQNVSLVSGVDVNRVHEDTYRRYGHHYSASIRVGGRVMGGDYSYMRLDSALRWYLPLKRPQSNVNVQYRLGYASRNLFGNHLFSVGGGELLRGMRTGTATGNALSLLNVEYLSSFFAYPSWRWVAFTDIGNVYEKRKINLLDQHIRWGLGLRYKLAALTRTDLRLDLAWDPRRDKLTPYLSSSVTF